MGSKGQDFREAVEWVKSQGWRVDDDRGGYPMAFCACGNHHRSIKKTPSGARYYQQMRNWIGRQECMRQEQEGTGT